MPHLFISPPTTFPRYHITPSFSLLIPPHPTLSYTTVSPCPSSSRCPTPPPHHPPLSYVTTPPYPLQAFSNYHIITPIIRPMPLPSISPPTTFPHYHITSSFPADTSSPNTFSHYRVTVSILLPMSHSSSSPSATFLHYHNTTLPHPNAPQTPKAAAFKPSGSKAAAQNHKTMQIII